MSLSLLLEVVYALRVLSVDQQIRRCLGGIIYFKENIRGKKWFDSLKILACGALKSIAGILQQHVRNLQQRAGVKKLCVCNS